MSIFSKTKNRFFPYSHSSRKNKTALASLLPAIDTQHTLRMILVSMSLFSLVFHFPCYSKMTQKKVKKTTWEHYWTRITFIDDPELFQSKKRKDRLASVTRTDPVNSNQLPDSKQFFKKLDLKKKGFLKLYQLLQIGM